MRRSLKNIKNKDKALIQHEDKTSTKQNEVNASNTSGGTKPHTEKTAQK